MEIKAQRGVSSCLRPPSLLEGVELGFQAATALTPGWGRPTGVCEALAGSLTPPCGRGTFLQDLLPPDSAQPGIHPSLGLHPKSGIPCLPGHLCARLAAAGGGREQRPHISDRPLCWQARRLCPARGRDPRQASLTATSGFASCPWMHPSPSLLSLPRFAILWAQTSQPSSLFPLLIHFLHISHPGIWSQKTQHKWIQGHMGPRTSM